MDRGLSLFVIFLHIFIAFARRPVLVITPHSPVFALVDSNVTRDCTVKEFEVENVALRWTNDKHSVRSISRNKTLALMFHPIKYSDEGVYCCQAINQTTGLVVNQKFITVKVGDPPSISPSPILKRVCGNPLNEVLISYQYVASATQIRYPVTMELFLSALSRTNPCFNASGNFTIVGKSRRTVSRSENISFDVDASEIVKKLFPNFPYDNIQSKLDGTMLCGFVRTTNPFQTRFSEMMLEDLLGKATCGKVDDLRVVTVGRDSVSLAWGLPRCLKNTSKPKVNYWLWCKPSCGSKRRKESSTEGDPVVNDTISSLLQFTSYTFYVSCSFLKDPFDAGEKVSISVQTKEGVPRVIPTIEQKYWLSECSKSNVLNGTALISWKHANDKEALLGKVRHYIITYQGAHINTSTRIVQAGKMQLVLSGLRMDQGYNFTIKLCTGGGCGKESLYYRLSPNQCEKPVELETQNRRNSKSEWQLALIGVVGGCVCVSILIIVIIYLASKQRRVSVDFRNPALPSEIDFPIANLPISERPDDIYTSADLGLGSNTTCLSRTSSVLTCNTDL